jgi:4-hydroxy-tetrahydrodipicolinate synthase
MSPFFTAPIRGIVPPLVTPLTPEGRLDEEAVGRLIEHIVAAGVGGVFVLGTTGEGPCFSAAVQGQMIRASVGAAAGRIPVLVGISSSVVDDSKALARISADAGAAAVVLAPPFYLPAVGPDLRRHAELLLAASPLPIYLYNMPSLVKTPIPLDLVRWAVDQPGIAGLKDSSGDFTYFHQALQLARGRPDFGVFIGPEQLLGDAILFGAHGGVCGGAQVFPKLYVGLANAAKAGDLVRMRDLNDRLQTLSRLLYGTSGYAATVIRGIKTALHLKGLAGDTMSEPFGLATGADRDRIRAALDVLDPLMAGV